MSFLSNEFSQDELKAMSHSVKQVQDMIEEAESLEDLETQVEMFKGTIDQEVK